MTHGYFDQTRLEYITNLQKIIGMTEQELDNLIGEIEFLKKLGGNAVHLDFVLKKLKEIKLKIVENLQQE